jgi:GNAT superfamily N-acetyltransferase
VTEIRELKQAAELDELRRIGVAAGLEPGDGGEDVIVAWGAFEGLELVGGIALETLLGLDLIGWLVVDERRQGKGIGRRLLTTLEDEARRRGVVHLWATARAPGFFMRAGYAVAGGGGEREILLPGCFTCDQYQISCHPKIVKKDLQARSV